MISFLYKLMTTDIGGVTILGDFFSDGLNYIKNKILASAESKKNLLLLSEFYSVLQSSFQYFYDENVNRNEDITLAADTLWIEWSKQRILSKEIVAESLKKVKIQPSNEQVAIWYEKFIELIVNNEKLKECFMLNTLMEIESQNKTMKVMLQEILSILKVNEKSDTITYPQYISNPPFSITDEFLGRDEIVEKVYLNICNGVSLCLYGIGGIGKTEIAKAVVKKIRNVSSEHHGIYKIAWINYKEGDFKRSLTDSLLDTKNVLSVEEAWKQAICMIEDLGTHLLIIIDNIENDNDEMLLSTLGNFTCRIIATSRINKIKSLIYFEINELSIAECRKLFYSYYTIEKDDVYLNRILNLIDYHTVMVELLSKIAEIENILLMDLEKKLINLGFKLSDETTSVNHELMRNEDILIEHLKKLFSIMKCKEIEKEILMKISVIPALEFEFDYAKKWFSLTKKSLLFRLYHLGWIKKEIKNSNQICYVMHSIVAAAIRTQFEDSIYDVCIPFIREITKDMEFGLKDVGAEKKWIIQFSWSINDILNTRLCDENDAQFLINLARLYKEVTNYSAALQLYNRVLEIYFDFSNIKVIQIGEILLDIAVIYECLSEFSISLNYYKAILLSIEESKVDIRTKILLGRVFSNIADIYRQLNNYDYAQLYFNKAITLQKKFDGDEILYLATTYNNRAVMYDEMGDYDYALDNYNAVLKIRENILGINHPDIGTTLNNIAVVYYNKGLDEMALDKYERAYNIYKNYFGEQHNWVATVQHNIGTVLERLKRYGEALKILYMALDTKIELVGECHPEVAATYNSIGNIYFAKSDYDNALIFYNKALDIRCKKLPMDHYLLGFSNYCIGKVYQAQKQYKTAVECYRKAYNIFMDKLGNEHKYTKETLKNLEICNKNISN